MVLNEDRIPFAIGTKLDGLAKLLKLFPYNKEGVFKGKLKPVSHSENSASACDLS